MLIFNPNVRTRTSYSHPIQFGEILEKKRSLFSFSKFEDRLIREIYFHSKSIATWKYDEDNFLKSYQLYNLGSNVPNMTGEITIREKDKNKYEFYTVANDKKGDWSIADYYNKEDGIWEIKFSRVHTFLGYNIRFIEEHQNEEIERTLLYKHNYELKKEELVRVTSHEYQYHQIELEKLVEEILTFGWKNERVKEFLQKIK